METDSHALSDEGGPPLDESWWAAIMEEGVHRPGVFGGDGPARRRPPVIHDGGAPPIPAADAAADWLAALAAYEQDQVVELPIIGVNRGGLLAAWGSLRGFVPSSHLIGFPPHLSEDQRRLRLVAYVGQPMALKVIEYDRAHGRIVLSERAAQAGPGRRLQVLERLQPDSRVRGTVTNICDFGVFVDLGGVEGLVHVSEVSWSRVHHPGDVLRLGQEITVYVIHVDKAQAHIALSLKRLLPDPWATVEQRYSVGQIVEGTITTVVPFGAFACLEDGLEGLIHVSELADGGSRHPRQVVREGDRVFARVVNIDSPRRRLGLSLRSAREVEH